MESDKKLFYQTLKLESVNSDINLIRQEWVLKSIEYHEEFTNCICNQPIKERCYIENKYNSRELIIGNVCILEFLDINLKWFFEGIKSCKSNNFPNLSFIEFIYQKKIINEFEYKFIVDLRGKKLKTNKYTEKQRNFKDKILNKIYFNVKNMRLENE